jgi:hypothetical protein
MNVPMFINSAQVAQLLDLPASESFLARRADLEERGFPLPCSWIARPMKWRRELVAAWIETQGLPRALGERPRLVAANAHLMARAGSA